MMDKKLFLIDGHALVFKMYYAFLRHPMINSKGADMSVLFGFTKYLLELIEKEKPTHLAVSFDPPGGTFRHEMFPDYKGTRAETPQLVIDSLDPLIELCGALRIPVLMVGGFEADDVIGTVSVKAAAAGCTVYMVTPDKDYGQLVTPTVLQYKPGKSGGENEILGPAEICGRYGISSPSQVVDMLTICGDTSDNVPGVKGVGEVGAGKLISKYGSVDGVYAHLDELTPKQREAFSQAKDHIALSRELVTIRTDVPVDFDLDAMRVDMEYDPLIVDLFEKYEFTSLLRYIKHIKADDSRQDAAKPELSVREAGVAEVISAARRSGMCSVVLDYGADGIFAPVTGVTVGVADGGRPAGLFGESSWMPADTLAAISASGSLEDFAALLADGTVAKAGYDLKRQCDVLRNCGRELAGRLFDIELMHYLLDPEKSHRLDILAKAYLGIDVQESSVSAADARPLSLFDPVDETVPESHSREAAAQVLLAGKVLADLEKNGLSELYLTMEEPLVRVLSSMECDGVKVDLNQLRDYAESLRNELDQRQQRIREMAGEPDLNILSTRQIGYVLFEKLTLDPKVKAKTDKRYSYSTDEETLAAIAHKHPIVNEILEYRAVKKLLSTYIEPFPNFVSPRTGKIHTTFNQSLTSTGRLSSSKPNLQNIPIRTERGKEIRKAFVPSSPDRVILSADYSQIELRIMAHLSQDSHLLDAFNKGEDVHAATASKIFGIPLDQVTPDQRRIAKTANFGIMYGISSFGLSQRLKISRSEAKDLIDGYFGNFPSVRSFIDSAIASVKETGYARTLFGRRRYLPEINSSNATVRANAERNAINAPIQGTSADIIKKAMIGVSEAMSKAGLRSRMVLQIHDELVFDAFEEEIPALREIVVREMENVIKLSVPLTVECNYGKNWLEAH
ncbi:MAG: DNA polymerase I [Candidatus Cryptobacteroides sp.]